MLKRRIIEEVMLYEGLEISHEIHACLTNLIRMWNFDNTFFYEKDGNTIKMIVQKPSEQKTFDSVIKHIENFLGYFPSHIVTKTTNFKYDPEKAIEAITKKELFGVYFDAKYDMEISEDKLPPTLYHISPSQYEEKILKIEVSYVCYTHVAVNDNYWFS